MKKVYLLLINLIIGSCLFSQDTLTVVQYNLLNYGNFTSYCTDENNNIDDKDEYLKTIISYTKPDIFSVNEISSSVAIQQRMLDNNLNIEGVDYYRQANFIKISDSYIVNSLYFNLNKLILHSHTIAQSYLRDIDVYKLYYRSDDLEDGDTAFLNCVVAHLKASSGTQNQEMRSIMVSNTLDYLENYNSNDNYLFMGDFNVYTNSEPAYQLLTNNPDADLHFYDPIDSPGVWHNKSTYKNIHTQSTHSSQNGCAASGGMDDRFDFILISDNIRDGLKDLQYIDGSYKAIGQDGLHFNKSIIDEPENQSAPSEVIDALYGSSDHLPILLKLRVDKTLGISKKQYSLFGDISISNFTSGEMNVSLLSKANTNLKLEILSVSGRTVYADEREITVGRNQFSFNTEQLSMGVYIVVFTDGEKGRQVKKVIVN